MFYYNIGNPYDASETRAFSPYSWNGGSIVAIAGEDFAIIGCDTRLSVNNTLISRNQNKLFKLSNKSVLGTAGCWADCVTLTKMLDVRMRMYTGEHDKTMSTPALAQMLSVTMYNKRFFPYCVLNLLAGIDEEGKGCVYNYDVVGHCERSTFRAVGSAGALLQPLLDNQIGLFNMQNVKAKPLSKRKALSLLKDAFTCATERDTHTGDSLQILTITAAGGICEETFSLRKD